MFKIYGNRGISAVIILLCLTVILLAIVAFQGYQRLTNVTFDTPYQVVFLSNGQAYIGRLENLGSRFLVLTDVYYVTSQLNQETKHGTDSLIKRGKEWHAPDRMILNAQHVLFIEPVGSGSAVAKLIERLRAEN